MTQSRNRSVGKDARSAKENGGDGDKKNKGKRELVTSPKGSDQVKRHKAENGKMKRLCCIDFTVHLKVKIFYRFCLINGKLSKN